MGRWQRKLLFTLFVYFAGFGTAIYVLAPAQQRSSSSDEPAVSAQVARAGLSAEDLSQFKEAMHRGASKLKDFAEEQTVRAAGFFRQHLDQQTERRIAQAAAAETD